MSEVATIQKRSVLIDMASRFGMEPAAFEATVRATCIKPDKNGRVATREEFAAFLLVAKEYNLNPLTKEIYAFMDKSGAVVPIVSVDGWANLINSHPAFDGMDFDDAIDDKGNIISIMCRMYRKDRSHAISVTEYMAECRRDIDTWKKWPRRMLRHKSMIQAARYAFGFAGIYDEDEGERIIDAKAVDIPTPPTPPTPPVIEHKPAIIAEPVERPEPIEATIAQTVPPTQPDARAPINKHYPLLTDKLRAACDEAVAAKDVDALEKAWDEIAAPHLINISFEQHEELMAIYTAAEKAFEQ